MPCRNSPRERRRHARRPRVRRRNRVPARLSRRLQPRGHRAAAARSSTIDGSHKNPVTDGYICAKVRKFGERVYGPDRLLYPAVRKGRKGEGQFKRVSWDEALELDRRADSSRRRPSTAAQSILPYSYGGSNGLLTQDNLDAQLWRRFGTSRLARTRVRGADRRRQHGALRQDAVGHLPGLSRGAADHAVGREPVRVRHSSRSRTCARRRSAARSSSSIDPRTTPLARVGRHASAGQARHRRRRRAGDPPVSVRERLRRRGVSARAHDAAPTRCASAPSRGRSSRRPTSPASTPRRSSASRELYADELAGARSAAAGASSATATAATPRWRCWRCRRSAASSASAAAATR